MKNKISFLSVIILSLLFIVVSCKKNTINTPESNSNNNTYSKTIVQRINQFNQQMQGHFKNGTMMTLDTAVWNLEALLTNYGGYPDSASDRFILMHSHFTLPTDANGLVSMDDVQALYQQMVDSITAQLNGIAGTVKFLKFSDVQQDSVVGSTAYITSNNGYGQGFILGLYPPFTDDWIWGTLDNPDNPPYMGNCDQTDFSSDGSNEIQYRLNHPAAVPYMVGYTDLITRSAEGNTFTDPQGNPRLYWDPTADGWHCMSITELTDNLTNAHDIINTYDDVFYPNTNIAMGLRPHEKSFVSVEIIDDILLGSENASAYLHYYYVTYGTPYDATIQ